MQVLPTIQGEIITRYGTGADVLSGAKLLKLLGLNARGYYDVSTEYYRGDVVQDANNPSLWFVALQTSTGATLESGENWTELPNVNALSTSGGAMMSNASINWSNGSAQQAGTYDFGDGSGGFNTICTARYGLNWAVGVLRALAPNLQDVIDLKLGSNLQFTGGKTIRDANAADSINPGLRRLVTPVGDTLLDWSGNVLSGGLLAERPRLMSSWLANENTNGEAGYIDTNLEWVGTPAYVPCGYDGYSFQLDGSNYLVLNHEFYTFTSGVPFSILLWVRTSVTDLQALFGVGDMDPVGFHGVLMDNNGVLGLDVTDAGTFTGGSPINDGVWHMVVVTYDGAYLNLYRDGWRVARVLAVGMNNSSLFFGAYTAPISSWVGDLDHISVYSGVLSDTEIRAAYADHQYVPVSSTSYDAGNLPLRRLGMPVTLDSAARKGDCLPVYRRPKSGTYFTTVQLSDLGGTIWTDQGLESYGALELPPLRLAVERGGAVRVRAARDYANTEADWFKAIAVYANQTEDNGGNRFVFGNYSAPMFSLYNTGAGDYLELTPYWDEGEGSYWLVTNFSGLWEDRD